MKLFRRKKIDPVTQPVESLEPVKAEVEVSKKAPKPKPAVKEKKVIELAPVKAPRRWRVVLSGVLLLLLFAGTGAGAGYAAGIQQRLAQQNQQVAVTAATHFNYGLQAMLQGNYEVARLQFEYVLKIYPDFPGLREKYTEVMVAQAASNQPTAGPQATPTPDNRGAEALFAQAQQDIIAQNWLTALTTLEALRNADKNYRTLDVDGLYYLALRFGAIEKIGRLGDPEGGLYDFTLANRFAPLDHDALNYAGWARNFVNALAYWEVDWEKTVFYMSQVYLTTPGLMDSSGWTAAERHRVALYELGNYKVAIGEPCEAVQYYQSSLTIREDESVRAWLTDAELVCQGPALTQAAIPTATITVVVPTVETPTETPEPSPTP